jgi:hypothetical protein
MLVELSFMDLKDVLFRLTCTPVAYFSPDLFIIIIIITVEKTV